MSGASQLPASTKAKFQSSVYANVPHTKTSIISIEQKLEHHITYNLKKQANLMSVSHGKITTKTVANKTEVTSNNKPDDDLGPAWLRDSRYLILATSMLTEVKGSVSLPRGGAENMISWNTGSLKQLIPESSNFRHLARVLLANAKAVCFKSLETPPLEAPRVPCQKMMHCIILADI